MPENLDIIKKQHIENLDELLAVLKDKDKIQEFSKQSGLPANRLARDYLHGAANPDLHAARSLAVDRTRPGVDETRDGADYLHRLRDDADRVSLQTPDDHGLADLPRHLLRYRFRWHLHRAGCRGFYPARPLRQERGPLADYFLDLLHGGGFRADLHRQRHHRHG